jgi:hypothetical protein
MLKWYFIAPGARTLDTIFFVQYGLSKPGRNKKWGENGEKMSKKRKATLVLSP